MNHKDDPMQDMEFAPADVLAAGEVVIGLVSGLSPTGKALVDFPQNLSGQPLPAISTTAVNHQHSGRQVALMFADGDLSQPLIIGFIHSPLQEMIESFELSAASQDDEAGMKPAADKSHKNAGQEVIVDGKKIVIEGQEEIVLRCGEASITLTRAGKILIRGKYLLNRSTGVNRILGGSVQVN